MKEHEMLLRYILPAGILDYFRISRVEEDEYLGLSIYLEEKNIPPEEYKDVHLKAHGFHKESTIRDFPLRGKPCFLKVKRRRWLLIESGKVISRNWDIVAKGTRITEGFATFLKGINR
jgi:hypothetical protein